MNFLQLAELTEAQLFQLMKKPYPDIIDLNEKDQYSPLDWYIPSRNLYCESKCRKEHHPTLFVQKDKWDQMRKVEFCWYINSTPQGVYVFEINLMEEPVFIYKTMKKSQLYEGYDQYERKLVAELLVSKANCNLDSLLFN